MTKEMWGKAAIDKAQAGETVVLPLREGMEAYVSRVGRKLRLRVRPVTATMGVPETQGVEGGHGKAS